MIKAKLVLKQQLLSLELDIDTLKSRRQVPKIVKEIKLMVSESIKIKAQIAQL